MIEFVLKRRVNKYAYIATEIDTLVAGQYAMASNERAKSHVRI